MDLDGGWTEVIPGPNGGTTIPYHTAGEKCGDSSTEVTEAVCLFATAAVPLVSAVIVVGCFGCGDPALSSVSASAPNFLNSFEMSDGCDVFNDGVTEVGFSDLPSDGFSAAAAASDLRGVWSHSRLHTASMSHGPVTKSHTSQSLHSVSASPLINSQRSLYSGASKRNYLSRPQQMGPPHGTSSPLTNLYRSIDKPAKLSTAPLTGAPRISTSISGELPPTGQNDAAGAKHPGHPHRSGNSGSNSQTRDHASAKLYSTRRTATLKSGGNSGVKSSPVSHADFRKKLTILPDGSVACGTHGCRTKFKTSFSDALTKHYFYHHAPDEYLRAYLLAKQLRTSNWKRTGILM